MEKIPVNIIISKNKNPLLSSCNLWYIPYCPYDIKDVDDWYDKIASFIESHDTEYNILHIPNTIYDKELTGQKVQIIDTKHLFIVGIGNTNMANKLIPLSNDVPDGYHIAYSLQRNVNIYDLQEQKENADDILFEYVNRILLYLFFGLLCIMYLFR